ncbi:MAG: hypothetical protein AB7S65_01155 [Sulfuricurvum sp.]
MKSVILLVGVLIAVLGTYLWHSHRFPYLNAKIYQQLGFTVEAEKMYREGCVRGNVLSCTEGGKMVENGEGVDQNLTAAYWYYRKGSDMGYIPAAEKFKTLNAHYRLDTSVR